MLTSGESGDEIVARLKRDVLPTLRNGLLYWPICDFITYKFVPVHLQVHFGESFLSKRVFEANLDISLL